MIDACRARRNVRLAMLNWPTWRVSRSCTARYCALSDSQRRCIRSPMPSAPNRVAVAQDRGDRAGAVRRSQHHGRLAIPGHPVGDGGKGEQRDRTDQRRHAEPDVQQEQHAEE